MENKDSLKQPLPNRLYGTIIYWVSIIAAIICIVAPVIALAFPESNVLSPQYLFSTIWQGAKPAEVWATVGNGFPGGHFWINSLGSGDGLIQMGIVLGGFCAGLALLGAAVGYLKQKPRNFTWALLSVVITVFILLSAIGIYTQAE
ncbi:MAG: hypothetical protein JW856_05565 [Dehalococcoidales bacterium]|nr:hypothetical protein [Dehalococcoidales bacterium]